MRRSGVLIHLRGLYNTKRIRTSCISKGNLCLINQTSYEEFKDRQEWLDKGSILNPLNQSELADAEAEHSADVLDRSLKQQGSRTVCLRVAHLDEDKRSSCLCLCGMMVEALILSLQLLSPAVLHCDEVPSKLSLRSKEAPETKRLHSCCTAEPGFTFNAPK